MKITTEDLGDRQVLLTIEVDEERVDKALRGAARRISRQYNIPGFRRGRAPYHVILRRFGREALLQEVLEDLGQEVITEGLEEADLEPYAPGSLEDMQLDPLVLKMRVPLRPVVDLGDYRELRMEPPVVAVNAEEVDDELERLRQANAVLEPADDRSARLGDMLSLDVNMEVNGEPYLHEEEHSMLLDVDDDNFAPGFAEQVVGMVVGEEKDFTLALPQDEASDEDVGEREATFSVKLRTIQNRILPDLDDDLARTVGDFDTLEELRQEVRRQFEEDAQRRADQEYSEKVLEALIAGATIEYPPDMVEDNMDDMLEDMRGRVKTQGIELDDWLKLSGQTEEAFRESMRPSAERSVQRGLALGELVGQEKLNVEGEEVDQRIALMSASWGARAGEVQQMLTSPQGMRSITNDLLTDKAIQRLVAIAKGEAPSLEEESIEESEATLAENETAVVESIEPTTGEAPDAEISPEVGEETEGV